MVFDVAPSPRAYLRNLLARHSPVLTIGAFLLVYGWLQYLGCTAKSATFDEPLHLTAGYQALARGDYRFDSTHPPFLRMWAALPLLGRPMPAIDTSAIDAMPVQEWTDRSYEVSRDFLFSGGEGDRLLLRARFMIAALGALLGVLLFAWAREWLGPWPATMALGLYAIEPNLTGHSGLVTTDAGITCFLFGSVYFLWRAQRTCSASNLAGLALFTALAAISKFSAVLLAPILVLLLAVAVLRRTAINLRRAAAIGVLLVASTVAAIWAAYGFRHAADAGGGLLHVTADAAMMTQLPAVGGILGWIDAHHLLPNAFTQGFAWSLVSENGLAAYLFGELSNYGWWYYFPVAFALKTPAAVLLLFAAGLILSFVPRGAPERLTRIFVLLPPAVYLLVAMDTRINVGIRHILPLFPFVLLVAVLAIREFLSLGRPIGRAAVVVTAALALALYARSWPSTLSFFNAYAGGPANGWKFLSDSNVDWGQQLKRLKQWMDANDVARINLAYFGTVDPASYGIDCTYLPGSPVGAVTAPRLPGYVAISPMAFTSRLAPLYEPLQDATPVAVVGHTLRIYWLEEWPEPAAGSAQSLSGTELDWNLEIADALLLGGSWERQAAFHYEAYLRQRPGDGRAWARYGIALIGGGRGNEASAAFNRAFAGEAQPGELALGVAAILSDLGHFQPATVFVQTARQMLPHDARPAEIEARLHRR